jgi:hypothetical protein
MRNSFWLERKNSNLDLDLNLIFGVIITIILRGIISKWEGVVGTGWSGLRIGTGGGHL